MDGFGYHRHLHLQATKQANLADDKKPKELHQLTDYLMHHLMKLMGSELPMEGAEDFLSYPSLRNKVTETKKAENEATLSAGIEAFESQKILQTQMIEMLKGGAKVSCSSAQHALSMQRSEE